MQSNSLKDLINTPSFCFRLARHFVPQYFEATEYRMQTSFGPVLLTNHYLDKIDEWGNTRSDVSFIARCCFEKSWLLNADGSIEKEINFHYVFKQLSSDILDVIARRRVAAKKESFVNALWHYRSNVLVVEEIEIEDLSAEEIRAAAEKERYKIVLLSELK